MRQLNVQIVVFQPHILKTQPAERFWQRMEAAPGCENQSFLLARLLVLLIQLHLNLTMDMQIFEYRAIF